MALPKNTPWYVTTCPVYWSSCFLLNYCIQIITKTEHYCAWSDRGFHCLHVDISTLFGIRRSWLRRRRKVNRLQRKSVWVSTVVALAVLNPFVGAILISPTIDRCFGCAVSVGMILIQAIQAYTISSTWFVMSISQAVVMFAYLPELAFEVGQEKTKNFSLKFIISQFIFDTIHVAFKTSTVVTAQVSQGIVAVSLVVFLGLSWLKYLPKVNPRGHCQRGNPCILLDFYSRFRLSSWSTRSARTVFDNTSWLFSLPI